VLPRLVVGTLLSLRQWGINLLHSCHSKLLGRLTSLRTGSLRCRHETARPMAASLRGGPVARMAS
jgi:hypothetical protein